MKLWIISSPVNSSLLLTNVDEIVKEAKTMEDVEVREVDFSAPLTVHLNLDFNTDE